VELERPSLGQGAEVARDAGKRKKKKRGESGVREIGKGAVTAASSRDSIGERSISRRRWVVFVGGGWGGRGGFGWGGVWWVGFVGGGGGGESPFSSYAVSGKIGHEKKLSKHQQRGKEKGEVTRRVSSRVQEQTIRRKNKRNRRADAKGDK